ncbi:MAG TPA: hypothetical protein VGG90_12775 [Candidatus Dormibacteraeota bacterium]
MEVRQAAFWIGLLFGGQATDTWTTQVDSARGALEAMPVSAQLLDAGGIALFWGTKCLLVATAASALLLAARWVRPDRQVSRVTFRVALLCIQAATVGLAWVSVNNVMLLRSLAN